MDELEKMLLEVKDTSELMVDLAYSSLLFDNKDIACEVCSLKNYVDELTATVQQEAIRKVLVDGDISKSFVTIRLVESLENICSAAKGIADVVMKGLPLHPVIKLSIQESDVIITTGQVSESSDLADKTLGETRLASNSGMWVVAIKRERKYIYGPDKNTTVLAGDTLIARGPREGEEYFKDLMSGKAKLT
ncbi:MAG: TrkA C-terminal domain-containing protein [Methanomassiliicoccales archaeon]